MKKYKYNQSTKYHISYLFCIPVRELITRTANTRAFTYADSVRMHVPAHNRTLASNQCICVPQHWDMPNPENGTNLPI